jgi:hypothetical protein
MARGDHVYVRRGRRYTHHGVDCGDGTVIHYSGPRGTVRQVARTSWDDFAAGDEVKVRVYGSRLSTDDTVDMAESRIGSVGYSLVRNNCEHFAAWCCTGRAVSAQVRAWLIAAQGTVASLFAAQSLGPHVVIAGTIGAGVYAASKPLRRR